MDRLTWEDRHPAWIVVYWIHVSNALKNVFHDFHVIITFKVSRHHNLEFNSLAFSRVFSSRFWRQQTICFENKREKLDDEWGEHTRSTECVFWSYDFLLSEHLFTFTLNREKQTYRCEEIGDNYVCVRWRCRRFDRILQVWNQGCPANGDRHTFRTGKCAISSKLARRGPIISDLNELHVIEMLSTCKNKGIIIFLLFVCTRIFSL